MSFAELIFRRINGLPIKLHDYVKWANELLEEGCDTPSFWELAACRWDVNADPDRIETLFQSCINDLRLNLPND